eukprot:Lankesteria_metandrocarpae@DN905_c0_g1_i1.p1
MMIYIFLLVLPLLVTVPTLAVGYGKARTVRPASFSRRSGLPNQHGDPKAAAFVNILMVDENTRDIVLNASVDTSEAMINVSGAFNDRKVDAKDILSRYIKSALVERFTHYLAKTGVDPVYVA